MGEILEYNHLLVGCINQLMTLLQTRETLSLSPTHLGSCRLFPCYTLYLTIFPHLPLQSECTIECGSPSSDEVFYAKGRTERGVEGELCCSGRFVYYGRVFREY